MDTTTDLAVAFERHRPVGVPAVFDAWCQRAAVLGLHPGERADLSQAAFRAGASRPDGPYRRAEVDGILDQLERAARRRRPLWRLVADGGTLALLLDPEGAADNLAALVPELRARAAELRQRHVVCAVERARQVPDPPTLRSLATRWGISLRTLMAWRAARPR